MFEKVRKKYQKLTSVPGGYYISGDQTLGLEINLLVNPEIDPKEIVKLVSNYLEDKLDCRVTTRPNTYFYEKRGSKYYRLPKNSEMVEELVIYKKNTEFDISLGLLGISKIYDGKNVLHINYYKKNRKVEETIDEIIEELINKGWINRNGSLLPTEISKLEKALNIYQLW